MRRILFIIGLILLGLSVSAQDEKVTFSHAGGFYDNSFSLVLSNVNPQNTIRFTTNGNCPTAQSQPYSAPLTMDENLYSKSDIYTIQTAPEYLFYLPETVLHAIVIRAAVFDNNGNRISDVATNSYFISSLGCDTHGLPAISLCADSLDLFGYERGIMVPGKHFNQQNPDWTGNYYQEGEAWERSCNIEFYEADNSGINQQAGLRTHGGNGRRYAQKSFTLHAENQYGLNHFKHKFFESISYNRFKHLVLKPFVSSWSEAGVQDYVCGRIASQLDIETLASRACVLYLNGEYWGIYFLQEKSDERFLEDHFGFDVSCVNIIGNWYGMNECGSNVEFNRFMEWLNYADLTQQESYDYVSEIIDINCFIDYQIFELYAANEDWPANNMRCWQAYNIKWRWIFYDGDGCLRHFNMNVFANATYDGESIWPSSAQSTLLFRKLLANPSFVNQFKIRFLELINTTFRYDETKAYLDYIAQQVQGEIVSQSFRFHNPLDFYTWNQNVEEIDSFLFDRPEGIKDRLETFFAQFDIAENNGWELKCFPNPTNGEIHIQFDTNSMSTEVEIYDVLGQKVFSKPCVLSDTEKQVSINPNLPVGVYFLKIGNYMQKIIRQ